jgi:hypothetical protein
MSNTLKIASKTIFFIDFYLYTKLTCVFHKFHFIPLYFFILMNKALLYKVHSQIIINSGKLLLLI